MNRLITATATPTRELKIEALASMSASFERFCLASGIEALAEMIEADARDACGPRHAHGKSRRAHRWGKTKTSPSVSRAQRSFENRPQNTPQLALRNFNAYLMQLRTANIEAIIYLTTDMPRAIQLGDRPARVAG